MSLSLLMARAAGVALATTLMFAAPAAADPTAPPVAGTSWRFVEVMGAAMPATVDASLDFAPDGVATGFSGCNHFSGQYQSAGTGLSFSDISYTKMWCGPAVMAVERGVQTALGRTSDMSALPGELDLLGSDGTVLARLVSATPSSS